MKYLWNRSPQGIWCLPLLFGVGVPMPITKAQALEAPPDTPKIPIVNEYHGQKVTDDYEWLENAEGPKVRAWTEAQTKRIRSYLESLPEYNQFLQEFQKDVFGKTVRYTEIKFAGGKVFASKFEPPKPQPVIICRTSLAKEGEERTVFDPAALDAKGLISYDWFEPSPDGSMIALSVSRGGSESGDLRFIRVADGKLLDEAKFLADQKYCSPATLGVFGGSNGGITIGGFITQHPDLSRAAAIFSGVLDVLRAELEPNGEFNTTEYGSVKNREQFLAKYGYSPYHHLVDGVKYPAVLIIAGENDHRVASWHGKKMAARLQAATSSGRPILLSVSTTAGHGFGTAFAERLRDEAALYTFFYDQLAMDAGPIGKR